MTTLFLLSHSTQASAGFQSNCCSRGSNWRQHERDGYEIEGPGQQAVVGLGRVVHVDHAAKEPLAEAVALAAFHQGGAGVLEAEVLPGLDRQGQRPGGQLSRRGLVVGLQGLDEQVSGLADLVGQGLVALGVIQLPVLLPLAEPHQHPAGQLDVEDVWSVAFGQSSGLKEDSASPLNGPEQS